MKLYKLIEQIENDVYSKLHMNASNYAQKAFGVSELAVSLEYSMLNPDTIRFLN